MSNKTAAIIGTIWALVYGVGMFVMGAITGYCRRQTQEFNEEV